MSATNLGSIFWRVDADTQPATNSMNDLDRTVGRTAKSITSAFSRIATGVLGGVLVGKLSQVQREFDRLNAQLITSTGSAKNAASAFSELERFASNTPYALEQSVTAFTKLVNLGLTPSENAMISYGNTASAMGKDLNQMIEAVADAATGEFERLKEFGIKAKNQGDTIAFTFQGTTKTVKNNAGQIEKYLTDIGNNNFAGAMANRMATFDGAVSNLGDTWDSLFRSINNQGAGTIMAESVRTATSAIGELITLIESGQLNGIMQVVANSWRTSFGNIATDISTLADFVVSAFTDRKDVFGDIARFFTNAFFDFPANVKAVIQIAVVELLSFVDKAKVIAKQLASGLNPFADDTGTESDGQKIIDITNNIADAKKQLADEIKRGGNTVNDKRFIAGLQSEIALLEKEKQSIIDLSKERKELGDESDQIDKRRLESISEILETRDKEIGKVSDERKEVEKNTIAWEKNQEIKKGKKRTLAGYKIKPKDEPAGSENKGLSRDGAKKFAEGVVNRGKSPIERLQDEHAKLLELKKKYAEDSAIYERAITANIEQQNDLRFKANIANANMILSSTSQLFGGIADIMKNSKGEQSSAYKAMFALSKGFAIAQAGLNLALAISNASAITPWYASLPAVAQTVSAGAAFASSIAGATYGGRENGGSVLANKTYEVGEKNKPELLMIPGNNGKVLSNSEMKGMMGGGGGYQPIINNYASNDGYTVQHRRDELTKQDVFDIVHAEMGNSNTQGMRGLQSITNTRNVLNGKRRT